MDRDTIEFMTLLYSRIKTAELAGHDYLRLSVSGVMSRELTRILRTEGGIIDAQGTLIDRSAKGEGNG